MKLRSHTRRRAVDAAVKSFSVFAALLGIAALAWILYEVVARGAAAIDLSFFTELPGPPGSSGGGVANALLGSFAMTALAVLFGVPAGLLAGIYLAEFGRGNRFGELVRFATNVMMGVPSIIAGLFAYTVVVLPLGHFSGYAGTVSLAIIMLPVVTRVTDDMLGMVPDALRESAMALGAPRWKMTVDVVFRAARSGLATGCLLAVARVSGETAPLLFTALNSPYWPDTLSGPTANLTVTIFNYAMSPYRDWQQTAWGASLVITVAVLTLTSLSRLALREKTK